MENEKQKSPVMGAFITPIIPVRAYDNWMKFIDYDILENARKGDFYSKREIENAKRQKS